MQSTDCSLKLESPVLPPTYTLEKAYYGKLHALCCLFFFLCTKESIFIYLREAVIIDSFLKCL